MRKQSIAVIAAASLAASVPADVTADTKDLLIGGAIGALVYKGISDSQKAKKQNQQVQTKNYSGSGGTAASLNSQYTKAERIQIQTAFRDLGYNIGVVDGVLGKNSRAVIRQFQATQGQAQTGQLTRPQYVALLSQVPGTTPVYARRELNRDEVLMLQQGLQGLGYYHGAIDGATGPGTWGALATFLAHNGTTPAQVTPVQSLVMARNAAGLPTPPYLQQEAGVQIAPAQPFATQQAGFPPAGQNPQQPNQGFAVQGQPQTDLFATPQTQQQPAQNWGGQQQPTAVAGQGQFATAPAQQQQIFAAPQQQPGAVQPAPTSTVFGAPGQAVQPGTLQGGTAPASSQQNLFAPNPVAPSPQQQAPQPVAPQGGQANTLFAAGTAAAPVQSQPQSPQSSLDIFSGTAPAQQIVQPNQLAGQSTASD